MIKKNKGKLILSSLAILLPTLIGFLLWDQLPAQMATHWGFSGEANGWSGRLFTVVGLPLIFLAVHWLCILITVADPSSRQQHPKAFQLVIWIMPVVNIMSMGFTYFIALGHAFSAMTLLNLTLGLMFVIIGNFMPKFKQNNTTGIKIIWTLTSEANWNATHRFAGKLWVAAGLVLLLCSFLPGTWGMVAILAALIPACGLPIFFSWRFHKKEVEAGTAPAQSVVSQISKRHKIISICMSAVLAVILAVVFFTGNVHIQLGDSNFTIEASYWQDITVEYAEFDSCEYRTQGVDGTRVGGYGSPRLSLGTFQNEEFGLYTRYTYTQCPSAIVLTSGEKVLVISGKDRSATEALWSELSQRIGK